MKAKSMRLRRVSLYCLVFLLMAVSVTAIAVYARTVRNEPAIELSSTTRETNSQAATIATSKVSASSPSFTMVSTQTFIPVATGQRQLRATHLRYQRSDGVFRLVSSYYGPEGTTSRVETLLGVRGLGVFRVDERQRRLIFTTPLLDDLPSDVVTAMRSDPKYNREESVQGLDTVVQREQQDGSRYTEVFRAPQLLGLVIKRVAVSHSGQEIVQPTSIIFGEPSPVLFQEFSIYSLDYSYYQQRVDALASQGNLDLAEKMRMQLQRIRKVMP